MKLFFSVSVVIPTYNAAKTICKAIDSVLSQSYGDVEIIVVDDGSTDDTPQRLTNYGEKIRYIKQENQERSAARNNGIRHSRGNFIAFLDADDTWFPEKLDFQMKTFAADPEVGMVFSQAYQVDERGKKLGVIGHLPAGDPGMVYQQLVLGNFIPSPTSVVRRECLEKLGGFDQSLRQGEDWDLWLRIAADYRLGFVCQPLVCYRVDTSVDQLKRMADRGITQARIQIIEKVAASGKIEPAQLCLARGLTWLEQALIQFSLGNLDHVDSIIQNAFTEEPGMLTRYPDMMIQRLVDLVAQAYRGKPSAKHGIELLRGFWQRLDQTEEARSSLRQAVSRFYADRFFNGAQVGDDERVLSALCGMVMNNPACLSNRGVWSIGLHSGLRKLTYK